MVDSRRILRRQFASRAAIVEAASDAARIDAKQFRNDVDAAVDQPVGR